MKDELMYFRLEYNEEQGNFHCEWEKDNKHPENTHGWKTIAYHVPDPVSLRFTEAMSKKYPILLEDVRRIASGTIQKYNKPKPSIELMRLEYLDFIKR